MSYTRDLDIAGIRAGLINGDFTAHEIVQSSFDAIVAYDIDLHSFLQLTPDAALEAADRIDAAVAEGRFDDLGPLAGVPVAFKDNMNLKGTYTTCASHMLEDYVSPYTATCVSKIIEAGGIPLGKLNMDEFAFGSTTESSAFGPTCNPWDLGRVPGGSSGGSAAAVAAGLVTMALGSDTGGSIRQPAAFCGVVGVKPTYGLVSRYGVVAFGSSLDQVGPFARTVKDAAVAMNALVGRDERDCTSQACDIDFLKAIEQPIAGMRIGMVPEFMEAEGLSAEVKGKIEEVAAKLEGQGASLVEVHLPNAAAAISSYYVLGPCEAFSNLARFDSVRYGYCDPGHKTLTGQYEASREGGFGFEARRRMLLGSYLLASGVYEKYYYPAQQVRTLITQDFAKAYEQCDVILMPASPKPAFKFGEIANPAEMYLSDIFTVSINIAGNGGMTVPVGFGEELGLPIGAQLVCPQFKDQNMFRAAAAIEALYGSNGIAPDFRDVPGATIDVDILRGSSRGVTAALRGEDGE